MRRETNFSFTASALHCRIRRERQLTETGEGWLALWKFNSRRYEMRNFLVAFTQEGRFFVARCPSLGVTSQGETLDEARVNIQEAIELYIESFGLDDLV
jgi:predicted RNase H-like HicB family nuclease